jgi:CDP-diacylglycerol pyrophosphatase
MVLYDCLTQDKKERLRDEAKKYPSTWEPILKTLKTQSYLVELRLADVMDIWFAFHNTGFDVVKFYKIFGK